MILWTFFESTLILVSFLRSSGPLLFRIVHDLLDEPLLFHILVIFDAQALREPVIDAVLGCHRLQMLLLHGKIPIFKISFNILPIRFLSHPGLIPKHARHGLLKRIPIFGRLQLLVVAKRQGATAQFHHIRVLSVQLRIALELIWAISLADQLVFYLLVLFLVGRLLN